MEAQVGDASTGTGISTYRGVGATLRARREQLGYDLTDVADRLRIRRAYLAAIEQGQVDDLPGPIYAVGFVRTYAEMLGYEPVAAAERFKAELALRLQPTRLSFPTPSPESRAPRGMLILLGLVIAAAAFAFWQYRQQLDLPDLALSIPGPPATAPAPEDKPAAATPPAAPVPPGAAAPPAPGEISPAPAPAPAGSPIAAPGPSRAVEIASLPPAGTTAPPAGMAAPSPGPAPAAIPAPVAIPAPAAGGASVAASAASRVVIRAVADSWVTITGTNNEVIVPGRILRPGDTLRLANRPDALLWTGNLGGLEVLIDDKPIPRLGQSGESRRNVSLDPLKLAAGNAVTR